MPIDGHPHPLARTRRLHPSPRDDTKTKIDGAYESWNTNT